MRPRTVLLLPALAALAAVAFAAGSTSDPANLRLNEIYASHSGTDDYEMIELVGKPNTPLVNYVVCIVEGEGAGAGTLDKVWNLSAELMPSDGYFVLGDTAELNKDYDLGTDNNIENGTETVYVIEADSPAQALALEALVGTDVDGDDDGDTDLGDYGTIVDVIAMVETAWYTGADTAYDDAEVVGPDGTFFPAGIYRDRDHAGRWATTYLDFDDAANTDEPRTPGSQNTSGYIRTYGTPQCDVGGCYMLLEVAGDTTSPGGVLDIGIRYGPGGAVAALIVAVQEGNFQTSQGCTLLVQPPWQWLYLNLSGDNPCEGTFQLTNIPIPVGGSGLTVYLQAIAADGVGGFIDSNGIELEFQ